MKQARSKPCRTGAGAELRLSAPGCNVFAVCPCVRPFRLIEDLADLDTTVLIAGKAGRAKNWSPMAKEFNVDARVEAEAAMVREGHCQFALNRR